MKTAWKKQNGIGKFPAEISDMMHSFQATGYPVVSKLNKCLKFTSIRGIKMTVFYLVVTLHKGYWVYPEDFKNHCTGVKDWSPRWSF